MLEECNTKKQHSVVHFQWEKGLNAKDIHKEMFLVYGGKHLSHKAVHTWVRKFSQGHSKVSGNEMEMRNWLRQQLQDFNAVGLRHTGKEMGHVYHCWWRISREINDFSRFKCHTFYILYPFVTYSLTLPYLLT
jgi:hypothetical protein